MLYVKYISIKLGKKLRSKQLGNICKRTQLISNREFISSLHHATYIHENTKKEVKVSKGQRELVGKF